MIEHLHVSIGPVQGFVSQSRRTRDLWSSSYLLSYLAAHAMIGARQGGGTIVRPQVDDDLMVKWAGGWRSGMRPSLGSVPNQFTVELRDGESPEQVATGANERFMAAWERVCRAVWKRFVGPVVAAGNGTEEIWRRQIRSFWELIWVAGAPQDLRRRKLWRTHWLPEEPGDKCSLMRDLQELSGYVRARNKRQQDEFWENVRGRGGLGVLNLDENERLCAVALVKRLYPLIAEAALGWLVDVYWPSTVDIAALPWCRRVLEAVPAEGNDFACAVSAVHDHPLSGGVSKLVNVKDVPQEAASFARLNADWFHRSFVDKVALSDESARRRLIRQLEALTEVEDAAGRLGAPPVYFALLLADGDQVGHLVATLKSDVVSGALATFTRAVPAIVGEYGGITVYAGGDDVLALLPLDGALQCGRDLERRYREAFHAATADSEKDWPATISAAVVFAHTHAPLKLVFEEAHRLLDDIAKAENGRSSLAAGIFRGNGPAVQWVTTWERAAEDGSPTDAVRLVLDTAQALKEGGLSSSLLQEFRRTLGLLFRPSWPTVGGFERLVPELGTLALIRGDIEHCRSRRDGVQDGTDPVRLASLLDELLRRSRKNEATDEAVSPYVGFDGLLLARFLAGGGREEEHLP